MAFVRSLLRRPDLRSRRDALSRLGSWGPLPDDPGVARLVLRASTATYPWVNGNRTDPADALARTLWSRPEVLDVAEIEGAYLIAGDRVRRTLLQLLALRRDDRGIWSLAHLLSDDGPTDLLPLPTDWLLAPVVEHPEGGRLAVPLARAAGRRGWAELAADLLCRLHRAGRLDVTDRVAVVATLAPLLDELVASCDRGLLASGHGVDPLRSDRQRAVALVELLEELPGPEAERLLFRALASADSRIGARAVVALAHRGTEPAPERPALLARDPEARAVLCDGFERLGRSDLLGPVGSLGRSGPSRAEAALVSWLAADSELGRPPDEVEHVTAVPVGQRPGSGSYHLFRFRLRSPHWSCARGWMVGLAGPVGEDGSWSGPRVAHSLYEAEDEDTPEGHLRSILAVAGDWPDDPSPYDVDDDFPSDEEPE